MPHGHQSPSSAPTGHLHGIFHNLVAGAISSSVLLVTKLCWSKVFHLPHWDLAEGPLPWIVSALIFIPVFWLSKRLSQLIGLRVRANTQSDSTQQEVRMRAREIVICLVKTIWVDGLLTQPLYRFAKVGLERNNAPNALGRPMELSIQTGVNVTRAVPKGIKMEALLSELGGAFLILGAPGAGKSTLLAELVRDLADRAQEISSAPVPLALSLARWSQRRGPIADWLIRELAGAASEEVVLDWIKRSAIVLLLDALDEVAIEHREECAAAINKFRVASPSTQVVVSCRADDYERLKEKLSLHNAVLVRRLTRDAIDSAIKCAGGKLAGLRIALNRTPELYDVLSAPLMLDVARVAFEGIAQPDIEQTKTIPGLCRLLIQKYTERMLDPKETPGRPESTRVREALTWIATNLERDGRTIFFRALSLLSSLPDSNSSSSSGTIDVGSNLLSTLAAQDSSNTTAQLNLYA